MELHMEILKHVKYIVFNLKRQSLDLGKIVLFYLQNSAWKNESDSSQILFKEEVVLEAILYLSLCLILIVPRGCRWGCPDGVASVTPDRCWNSGTMSQWAPDDIFFGVLSILPSKELQEPPPDGTSGVTMWRSVWSLHQGIWLQTDSGVWARCPWQVKGL